MARRTFRANSKAPNPAMRSPRPPRGWTWFRRVPISSIGRARSAISRMQAHGPPVEKKVVCSAIRRRYPGLAARSSVIPTRGGSGRRFRPVAVGFSETQFAVTAYASGVTDVTNSMGALFEMPRTRQMQPRTTSCTSSLLFDLVLAYR
jgi:hypothetical protein